MAIWEGFRTPPKCQFLKYPALKGRVSAGGRIKKIWSECGCFTGENLNKKTEIHRDFYRQIPDLARED